MERGQKVALGLLLALPALQSIFPSPERAPSTAAQGGSVECQWAYRKSWPGGDVHPSSSLYPFPLAPKISSPYASWPSGFPLSKA